MANNARILIAGVVNIVNNWWEITDFDMIQAEILDFYSLPTSGLVTFEPFLTRPVEIE